MKTYLAAVMPGPNLPIELREFPEPELEPGAALLHTMYSEVCGTDVHLHHGKLAGVPYPIIPGHVSVGRQHDSTYPPRPSPKDGRSHHAVWTVGRARLHLECPWHT